MPFFARALGRSRASTRRRSRTLDDLWRAPAYTVDDIRASIDAHPPWGDYQGVHARRRVARADARVHVGRHDRHVAADLLHAVGPRGRRAAHARALYMQGIRPGDVVLNSWAYGTHNGAFVFDEALYRWLNCVVLTTEHRQRHEQRTPGAAGDRVRGRPRSSPPATTCSASPTSRARWATTPKTDFKHPGVAQHRRPRVARVDVRRRVLQLVRLPRGAVGLGGVPGARRPAHLRRRVRRADRRSRDGRAAARRRARLDLHHRALQDRQPAVPVQHHGPLVPVPARAVRVRELAAQDGAVRGPRRQHGEAARRSTCGRKRSATIAMLGRRASRPTGSCARCARTTATR